MTVGQLRLSEADTDKITIEYVGNWSWDLALYLREARIEAFHDGQRVGEVVYKAPNSLNTNKFANAEEVIKYMMDIMLGDLNASEATKIINSSKKQK